MTGFQLIERRASHVRNSGPAAVVGEPGIAGRSRLVHRHGLGNSVVTIRFEKFKVTAKNSHAEWIPRAIQPTLLEAARNFPAS